MSAPPPVLRVRREGAVAVWTVCRPEVRHAIDGEVALALEAEVARAERDDDLRCVVLASEGDAAFVSGADLGYLAGLTAAQRSAFDGRMRGTLGRLAALPRPVIGALGGAVVGGGCELALACDVRVGEPHTTFAFKHAAMCVTPGWGGLSRLVRCVGRGTASRLLLTAMPLTAGEALRVGLLDELVEPGMGLTRALDLAACAAQLSAPAVAELKGLLCQAYAHDGLEESEQGAFARCVAGPDHAAALAAFAARKSR